MNAGTGWIVAALLMAKEADDGARVGSLLDQIPGVVASFTAGGEYDQECVTSSGRASSRSGGDRPAARRGGAERHG